VGIQAVNNVLFGRYKAISQEVKDYIYGLYGRPPAPIDPQVQELALRDYPRGQKPIEVRPGDILEPELEKAKEKIKDISDKIEDIITAALYPITGVQFLKYKYGLEKPPEKKPEEGKKEVRVEALKERPAKGPGLRAFYVFIGDEAFRVEVMPAPPETPARPGVAREERAEAGAAPKAVEKPAVKAGEAAIAAPLPGIVIRYEVKVGDQVKEGDPVVIFEAMKMQNVLSSPRDGVVKALNFEPGAKVNKGDILAIIGD